jgi:hypothetical protein
MGSLTLFPRIDNLADGLSLDSYPQGFDCSHPELWNPVVTNYYEYHEGLMSLLD